MENRLNRFTFRDQEVANENDGCVFFSPTVIVMFTVAILQQATVNPKMELKFSI